MTEKEAIANIINIVDDIKKTDDNIIKIADNLKMVLLNLKIEAARIKGNTGIIPIADALNRNITLIEDNLKQLISNNRETLVESLKVLNAYIEADVNDIHVYCTNCNHFSITENQTPDCKYKEKCDLDDCEDSAPLRNRPCYNGQLIF